MKLKFKSIKNNIQKLSVAVLFVFTALQGYTASASTDLQKFEIVPEMTCSTPDGHDAEGFSVHLVKNTNRDGYSLYYSQNVYGVNFYAADVLEKRLAVFSFDALVGFEPFSKQANCPSATSSKCFETRDQSALLIVKNNTSDSRLMLGKNTTLPKAQYIGGNNSYVTQISGLTCQDNVQEKAESLVVDKKLWSDLKVK